MIGPILLAIAGLATCVVSFIAAWQWRERQAPLHWLFFLAFGFGSLSVAIIYADIAYIEHHGLSKQYLLPALRILFGFILMVTFLASASVLVRRNGD